MLRPGRGEPGPGGCPHPHPPAPPFFAAKGIDWQATRDRYRPKVDQDTTRNELFAIFSDMVRPLYDAHVAVQDGDRVFAQVRPGTELPTQAMDTKVKKFIGERDLKGAPYRQDFAGGRITYADATCPTA